MANRTQRGPCRPTRRAPLSTSGPGLAVGAQPAPPASPPALDAAASARPRAARGLLLRAVGALVSGLLLVAAFPPYAQGLGALLGVAGAAGLVLVVRGVRARTGFALGLLAGLALFTPLLEWTDFIGADAWLGLSLLEALYVGLLGAALAVVQRLPGWPVWSAALWVGAEALRDRTPFGGFPWGRLAFSQADTPLTAYAALGGAPLVTAAVALSGGLLAAAVVAAWSRRGLRAVVAVGGSALVMLGGLLVPGPPAADGSATVALVQGNVPRLGLDAFSQRAAVLDNHVAATRDLAARVADGQGPRPDLVLWPENASDLDPFTDPAAAEAIDGAVRAVGVPVLVGAVIDGPGPDLVSNAGIVWDPATGAGERYVKRHPVPFGEYIPLRSLLTPFIDRLALIPRDFASGDEPGVLDVGPVRLGDVICFEVAYDDVVRDVVTGGGRLLVVQTNNASFGRSGQTEQQLAMSRLRAVEHGRAVAVVATSGVSAVIGPDGKVRDRAEILTREVLLADVPLASQRTVATRLGALPELALSLLGLGAVAFSVRANRRRRGRAAGVAR